MNIPGIIALTLCFTVVLAKMLISLRLKILKRIEDVENDQLREAQKELHQAQNKGKRLEANHKQLEVQQKSLRGALERYDNELSELRRQKAIQDSVAKHQHDLAERLRRQIK